MIFLLLAYFVAISLITLLILKAYEKISRRKLGEEDKLQSILMIIGSCLWMLLYDFTSKEKTPIIYFKIEEFGAIPELLFQLMAKNLFGFIFMLLALGSLFIPLGFFMDWFVRLHKMNQTINPSYVILTYFLFSNVVISGFFLVIAFFSFEKSYGIEY